jgi:cell wall-associated NlpC family hydrolase
MHKVLLPLLLSSSLLVGGIGVSAAAEQVRKPEEQSFLERYTNAAQDVILQGLKLVGVRYRWGGNDEDSGLDCSGFVRLVLRTASAQRCHAPPER